MASVIVVRLENLLLDPDNPVDLTALPGETAAKLILETYRFLGESVEVEITDGVVTITVSDEASARAGEALREYERAGRAASRGKWAAAAQMYETVLDILPDHTRARQDLAMVYMELGQAKAAKEQLIRVLQLEPQNARAYLILGNVYLKLEKDLGSADRYYMQAYELAPSDTFVLNSYGALWAERGEHEKARHFFTEVLTLDESHANARYGLALVAIRQGKPIEAFDEILALLARPRSADVRSEPVYAAARSLFVEAAEMAADAGYEENMERLRAEAARYEEAFGIPIEIREDPSVITWAKSELAWVYGRDRHVIRYRTGKGGVLVHLVAHEMEHIWLAQAARETGCSRLFTGTRETRSYGLQIVAGEGKKLLRQGLNRAEVDKFLMKMVDGLVNQLFNMPLDMVIEARLYEKYPWLRASQAVSLDAQQQENTQALNREAREISPKKIWRGNVAMSCAYALMVDGLWQEATQYGEAFRALGMYNQGQTLLGF